MKNNLKLVESEKDIQNSICHYLALKRYVFWRQNTNPVFNVAGGGFRKMPPFSRNGIPDIILIRRPMGRFVGLEVKRPKGKQSPNQILFQKDCEGEGGEYYVVTGLKDLEKIGL